MQNPILKLRPLHTDLAALLLRFLFGGLFIYHGGMKIASYSEYLNRFPDLIGLGSELSFILVIFAEFGCGLLVTAGFLTRLSTIPIFITMVVAFFVAHANDPFMEKELSFVFMIMSAVIFVLGSGKFSIDRLVFRKN